MCLYNVEHNFQESRKGASNAELITLIESNNIKRTISVERGAKNDIHKKIHCNFAFVCVGVYSSFIDSFRIKWNSLKEYILHGQVLMFLWNHMVVAQRGMQKIIM